MLTENKVTGMFCMADDFCKFFDAMMKKHALGSGSKRYCHRDSTMSKAEIMLVMILFHASGCRCLKHFYRKRSATIGGISFRRSSHTTVFCGT